MDIAQANDEFGIPGVLQICAGKGGFPLIAVDNPHARAEICGHGGQILSYLPADEPADLLFVSRQARFQPGSAIKGGVPVCWPWFGPDPDAGGRPDHGFVRTADWQLLSTETMIDGSTRVRLGTRDNSETLSLWDRPFALEIEVTVGERLEIALMTRNTGDAPMTLTQGLHTYFKIGDIHRAQVLGLAGYDYIDKAADGRRATQSGPINFDEPVNRIYLDTVDDLIIDDPALGRRIHIEREGSRSTVVWNPWIEQSRAMSDFGDDEYTGMVCVETTNAASDAVDIAPGASYRLASRYAIWRDD